MSLNSVERRLLRVSKLSEHDLKLMREGVSIEAALSRTVNDLIDEVSVERLRLAEDFLRIADAMRRSRSRISRGAVGRYYYAMYHAMRGVSFYVKRGDDFERHSNLFTKGIPSDYPNASSARNQLKDARLQRNEADYEPYPKDESYFRSSLVSLAPSATAFVATARVYLRSKGNPLA